MKPLKSNLYRILFLLLPFVVSATYIVFRSSDKDGDWQYVAETSVPVMKGVEVGKPEPPNKKFFKNWYAPFEEYEPDVQLRAIEQIKRLPNEAQVSSGKNKNNKISTHDAWEQKGPYGIQHYQSDLPTYYSGQVTSIDYNPSTGYFVATGSGGLWRQIAIFMVPVTDKLPTLSIGAVAIDPSNPDRIYVGTGNYQGAPGTGVYRSTDGGVNWQKLSLSPTPKRVSKIVIAPWDNSKIYAGTDNGLYYSGNSGNSWTQVFNGESVSDISMNATGSFSLMAINRKYVRVSTDQGNNWPVATGLPSNDPSQMNRDTTVGRISAAVFNGGSTGYVQIGNRVKDSVHSVYKTTNKGGSWTNITPPPSALTGGKKNYLKQQSYNNAIAVHPTDANIVWLAGVYLLRSSNGGSSWGNVGATGAGPRLVHVDIHTLFYKDATTFAVGSDGGIFTTNDEGQTWSSEINRLLPTMLFYNVAVEQIGGAVRYGGLQDNGIAGSNSDAPDSWILRMNGDGIDAGFNPASAGVVYAVINNSRPKWRMRSTNQGQNWIDINKGIDTNDVGQDFWGTRIIPGKSSSKRLFTNAGNKVYWSSDRGDNWSIAGSTNAAGLVGHLDANLTDNYIYAPNDAPNSAGGGIQRLSGFAYNPATNKWDYENLSEGLPVERLVKKVRASLDDSTTAYVLMNGIGSKTVFKTTDYGDNWIDITGDLPTDIPVNDILENPFDSDHLIIGTEKGSFATTNSGINWIRWNAGMPEAVRIMDLELTFHDGNLFVFAGTYGRSTFERRLIPDEPEPVARMPYPHLDFGTVSRGGSGRGGIKIINTGGAPLEVSSVSVSIAGVSVNPTRGSIAVGESLIFNFTYTPPDSVTGRVRGVIEFLHNGEGNVRAEINGYVGNATMFRSFIPESLIAKTAVKRKQNVLNWQFAFENNNTSRNPASALVVEFKNAVSEIVSSGPFGERTIKGKSRKYWTFSDGEILYGNSAVISGKSNNVKAQEVKRWWWTATLVDWVDEEEVSYEGILGRVQGKKLPVTQSVGVAMPNTANLREELFKQFPFSKTNPFIIGVVDSLSRSTKVAWVAFEKPGDLLASLLPGTHGITHSGSPSSFDSTNDGKEMIGVFKKLPPQKQSNKLFAELVALKLNIYASAMEKTLGGFGELRYMDNESRFNRKLVKEIAAMADTFMTYGNIERIGSAAELYAVIRRIDSAFTGTLDTLTFAEKLRYTGVRPIEEVPYLEQDPSIAQEVHTSGIVLTDVPAEFSLEQNYPNPFNP
ncbi:MAG: hypothetical protein HYZ33_04370, partial [Ignavibacteriales bacterium]|nr:hypothetical protein [Ignavibacteriales bacterium]